MKVSKDCLLENLENFLNEDSKLLKNCKGNKMNNRYIKQASNEIQYYVMVRIGDEYNIEKVFYSNKDCEKYIESKYKSAVQKVRELCLINTPHKSIIKTIDDLMNVNYFDSEKG